MLNAPMPADDVLTMTPEGLYCPAGAFHIDPLRPVRLALITHAHSDHARPGHAAVLATPATLGLMSVRYGEGFAGSRQAIGYGERLRVGDVEASFHPAGHVLGSAQILIQTRGARIVISGDYKRVRDPTCAPFEVVACDTFVTEATFGLPVFRHPEPGAEVQKLLASVQLFPERAHLLGAYSLGKAQRLVSLLREAGWDRPLYMHGAIEKTTDYYRAQGVELGDIRKASAADKKALGGEIVICPPSAMNDLWSRKFPDPVTAFASGWMRVRARARQRGVELPLVVSDHADWNELCVTIRETGCEEVWVTHGAEDALVYWAQREGLRARPLHMLGYGEEEEDEAPAAQGARDLLG
ncbi:MAG TPA: ligase-associated DNA damage response exonuclease [Beijerinckiaceae bacterium]|nr:ligase-associated DNA damage response exonuclease [Beijerinckiaceae bacterium]